MKGLIHTPAPELRLPQARAHKRVGNTMNPGTGTLTSFALWVPVLTRPAAYCPVREDEVGQTLAAGVSQDERPPS